MRHLIILLFLMQSGITVDNDWFIKKVISDFHSRYTSFILLEVESEGYKGEVVIENDDLYYYYNQTKGFDQKEYQNIIYQILREKSPVKINKEDFDRFNFLKVPNDPAVIANAKMGVKHFIKTYFDKRKVSKDNITEDQRRAIISQLYKFNVLSWIDCETGYLLIDIMSNKKLGN